MNTTFTSRHWLAAAALGMLGTGSILTLSSPALAHEAQCPVCKMDVVQDTEKLDHEVALRSGRKRIEYRSVYCALADAKSFTGDVTILAPSELKGKPVQLSRKGGQWSVAPEGAIFVGRTTGGVDHPSCQVSFRALTQRSAFEGWVKAHADVTKDAKPLSLKELLTVTGAEK